jgi:alkanesulfonate monooxygenase SsuD/methylene tetrahydromethanopterin reductase-like flavin-dependent oxidoreductase (luciferase family)
LLAKAKKRSHKVPKIFLAFIVISVLGKNERPIDHGLIEPLSEEEMAKIEMYSPENMRKNSIIGTPEEVVRRVKHCETLGYDEYSYWIDSSMSFAKKKRSLELFIEKVMPEFN